MAKKLWGSENKMTQTLIDKLNSSDIRKQIRKSEEKFQRIDDHRYSLPDENVGFYVNEELFTKSEMYFRLFLNTAKSLLGERFEHFNLNPSIQPDFEGGIYFNAIKQKGEKGIGYLVSIDLDGAAEYNLQDMDKNKEYKGKLNL